MAQMKTPGLAPNLSLSDFFFFILKNLLFAMCELFLFLSPDLNRVELS